VHGRRSAAGEVGIAQVERADGVVADGQRKGAEHGRAAGAYSPCAQDRVAVLEVDQASGRDAVGHRLDGGREGDELRGDGRIGVGGDHRGRNRRLIHGEGGAGAVGAALGDDEVAAGVHCGHGLRGAEIPRGIRGGGAGAGEEEDAAGRVGVDEGESDRLVGGEAAALHGKRRARGAAGRAQREGRGLGHGGGQRGAGGGAGGGGGGGE